MDSVKSESVEAMAIAGLVITVLALVLSLNTIWLVHQILSTTKKTRHVKVSAEKIKMDKIPINFTFQLPTTSAEQDVRFIVSSRENCRLMAFWGVPIGKFICYLRSQWPLNVKSRELFEPFRENLALDEILEDHQEKEIILRRSDRFEQLNTKDFPRTWYPLVVVQARTGTIPDSCDILAMVTIAHIRDTSCPLQTSIIAQYLKQVNGNLLCLKQLFVASDATANSLCVVCQANPLTRAILPCRHTCTCDSCFEKLENCPLCRGKIESYFLI
ncbi:Cell growth regulator with RING finger domain [Nesidiocoris tenuis]|uniref:Cell growth regulator with RING finger domain n=1 Tax=Nesidiocoris tenuis TaxID=355587 RepID=A0ABN7AL77_9HEMI|nr:Cell growth regulator with RING finger domain [Nesidiocoris tenuis]